MMRHAPYRREGVSLHRKRDQQERRFQSFAPNRFWYPENESRQEKFGFVLVPWLLDSADHPNSV